MTLADVIRVAILVEIALLVLYWNLVLRDFLSLRSLGHLLAKAWSKIGRRVPKYVSIPYAIIGLIGISYVVFFFIADSGTNAIHVGAPIILFLPVIVYLTMAPAKTRIDSLRLRRRVRSISIKISKPKNTATYRSKAMISWYIFLGLALLLVGLSNLQTEPEKGIVYLVASIYGFYWLTIVAFMPDILVTSQHIQIRKKKFEVLPFYQKYEYRSFSFKIQDRELKISSGEEVKETVRIDKIDDQGLAAVCLVTGARN